MFSTLRTIAAAGALAAVALTSADAAETMPFETAAFEAAQAQGRPIVVEIAAPWCPVCRAQAPIVEALADEPAYDDMAIFQVSFDDQRDVVRALGAQQQSTIIAYRGDEETDRIVGVTDPAVIAALFASTQAD